MINWIKQHKLEFFTILFILTLAAFFRFYRIDEYMNFLGDEGRDALVIKDILVNHHLPLLGPTTSVGNMYLGPLYYYMMAVAMSIFYLNPVAAAGMDAAIGVAVVFLVYYLSKEWFGKLAAFSASLLYALSPIAIIYSKSSWNPNPAPFFTLLWILGFFWARKFKNYHWLALSGFSLAAAIQMHYLALILIPVTFVLWVKELLDRRHPELGSGSINSEIPKQVRSDSKKKHFATGTLLAIVIFLLVMSPLVIFDFRHNFLNYRAITTFLSNKDSALEFNIFGLLEKLATIFYFNLINRYLTGSNQALVAIGSLLVALPIFMLRRVWPIFTLTTWLIIGIIGLSFYKQEIYDHYVGFLNPLPFLFLGANFYLLEKINLKFKRYFSYLLLGIILIFAVVDLTRSPLLTPPNRQLQRTQEVAKFVISQANEKPFNFALLAARNYDSAYQFYLDQYGYQPKQVPFDITDQLFVVCEDSVCDPTHSSKYEIAGFGMTKVVDQKEVNGVKVFKLVPNPSGKP